MFGKHAPDFRNVPVPSMSCVDRESVYKFVEHAKDFCREERVSLDNYLNWAVHVLLKSLASDNPSRMFLPKTDTAPFRPEMLFPFSAVEVQQTSPIPLSRNIVISPAWNNMDIYRSVAEVACNKANSVSEDTAAGYFIPEMRLVIIAMETERHLVEYTWGGGSALLFTVPVSVMDAAVGIADGCWAYERDGDTVLQPILDERFFLAYELTLYRIGGKTCKGKGGR